MAAVALAGLLALTGTPSAVAQGSCTARFNGVEAERVGSLSSPLILGADETLEFSGTDDAGTRQASVSLLLGPLTLGEAVSTRPEAAPEFTVLLDLADVAPRSVGLLRVRATTDNCAIEAWLRVGGRLPLTTSAGLAAIGLTVAGLAWLGAALVARRRWSPWVAAGCGIFTGTGVALLGQQLGRLQVSYWSMAACAALAAVVGLVPALLLRRKARPDATPAPAGLPLPTSGRQPDPSPQPAPSPQPEPLPQAASSRPGEARAQPAPGQQAPTRPEPAEPFWGYVLADVKVLHLQDYSRVVATLRPGSWYLVKSERGGWAQVEVEPGVEGWAPRRALHRER